MKNVSNDTLGLFSLNNSLSEQLQDYLRLKEARLANFIFYQLFPKAIYENVPIIQENQEMKLYSLVDFIERNYLEIKNNISKKELKQFIIPETNQAIWQFVEVLEGNVHELFQRIKNLEISNWNDEIYLIVTEIKELLFNCIEDLIVSIQRLEKIFQNLNAENFLILKFFKAIYYFFGSVLDRNILINLIDTRIYLNQNYKKFLTKFNDLNHLYFSVSKKIRKLKKCIVFSSLDKDLKKRFINLYKIVKLWEENKNAKIFSRVDFFKTIKHNIPAGKSYVILKRYLEHITTWFFALTEEWKLEKSNLQIEKTEHMEEELHMLETIIERYRHMLLSTDPNPYVRSRLGFKEWVVGPEPRKTKELLELAYSIDELKSLLARFKDSMKHYDKEEDPQAKQFILKKGIYSVIHDMGQPLASRSMMRSRINRLLELINECDELGGSAGDVGSLVTDAFLNAFRFDWHYQLLFENSKFQDLWTIHIYSERIEKDFVHDKRMSHFKKMVRHIENWIKQNEAFKHLHDLETDITDAKEQLQEYLSQVKRRLDSLHGIEKSLYKEQVKLQLLEYYELFDRFFFFLRKFEDNGKLILNQFQFIVQYLEATRQSIE